MWFVYTKKRRRRPGKHYLAHKEQARALIHDRLHHFNQHYGLTWNRVAIRNQRRCWGSCSSLGNLNFSYKLLFLPPHLTDYIVVHELCHLLELNHGQRFWELVAEQIPDHRERRHELRRIEQGGASIGHLHRIRQQYELDTLSSVACKT